MKDTVIICKNEKEYQKALEKLEKFGCCWLSGCKPTEKNYYSSNNYENNIYVAFNTLTTYSRNEHTYKEVMASDFVQHKPIVIYMRDREIVALDQETGKNAVAKCSPVDEFDFNKGAEIAFGRLMGRDVTCFYEDKDDDKSTKFKVGDFVKPKKGLKIGDKVGDFTVLDDMLHCDKLKVKRIDDGDILCDNNFWYDKEMLEHYVPYKKGDFVMLKPELEVHGIYGGMELLKSMAVFGKKMEVLDITVSGNCYCKCDGEHDGFYYSPEMLIPYEERTFKIGDKVILNENLKIGESYSGIELLDTMACFGTAMEVTDVVPFGNYECNGRYIYSAEMLKTEEDGLKIGDKVIVTDSGRCYTTNHHWVNENVKNPQDKVRYDYGHTAKNGTVGTVIAIAPHGISRYENLVYFSDDGHHFGNNCYLIGVDGVDKVYEF